MRLKADQVERLSELLASRYRIKEIIGPRADVAAIRKKIQEVVLKNLRDEEEIEREAREMLEAHTRRSREPIDPHKILLLIKQKLAEARGFVL
jgi:hypothetical protein